MSDPKPIDRIINPKNGKPVITGNVYALLRKRGYKVAKPK